MTSRIIARHSSLPQCSCASFIAAPYGVVVASYQLGAGSARPGSR
jgi:hypothetical protein